MSAYKSWPWPERPEPHLFGFAQLAVLEAMDLSRRLALCQPLGWGREVEDGARKTARRVRQVASRATEVIRPVVPYLRLAGRRGRLADACLFPPCAHEQAIAFTISLIDGSGFPLPPLPTDQDIGMSMSRFSFNFDAGPLEQLPAAPRPADVRLAAIAADAARLEDRMATERRHAETECYDEEDFRRPGFEGMAEDFSELANRFRRAAETGQREIGYVVTHDGERHKTDFEMACLLGTLQNAEHSMGLLPEVPGYGRMRLHSLGRNATRLWQACELFLPTDRRLDLVGWPKVRAELIRTAEQIEDLAAAVNAANRPTPPISYVPPTDPAEGIIHFGGDWPLASEPTIRMAERYILESLAASGVRMSGKELASRAGYSYDTARRYFGAMKHSGLIDRTAEGYGLTPSGLAAATSGTPK